MLQDSDNAYKRLYTFIKTQGNNFLFRFIGQEETLTFTKGKTPIVYKSPLRRTQDNILKWDNNVEKLLPFNIAVVKSFARHDEDKDLNIDTHCDYTSKNYGHLYYNDTDSKEHILRHGSVLNSGALRKKFFPEGCESYGDFVDWVKENYISVSAVGS